MDLFISTFLVYAWDILPWFVIGSLVAFIIDRFTSKHLIHTLLGKISVLHIFVAQAAGMISPLSIMSALPITGELINLGAQPLMLLSFLVAERAYDLQSFFIISELFGTDFAVINMAIIFIALVATALIFRNEKFKFLPRKKAGVSGFWTAQLKTLLIVLVGIVFGALLRVIFPLSGLGSFISTAPGSVVTSLVLGFCLYFGTVLGNYPVARALADLGMAPAGVLTFLSVSPVLNLVIISLFLSVVKPRYVLKIFGTYTLISLILSLLASVSIF